MIALSSSIKDFTIHIPAITPALGTIRQIAYVVDDIDQAISRWHDGYGLGPFVVARNEKLMANALYRGDISEEVVLDLAFAYIGELQLELISLKNDVPSMYREVLDRDQRELQHYGCCVPDFDRALACYQASGFQPIVQAGTKGLAQMHYVEAVESSRNVFAADEQCYMKTAEGYGIVLEIIEDNALTRPYFDGIRALVDGVAKGQLISEFSIKQLMSNAAI